MSNSTVSPIFKFLTDKENLPGVLEVIRYAEEIRKTVATNFWDALEKAINEHPKALPVSFSFEQKHDVGKQVDYGEDYFGLVARLAPTGKKFQGLCYKIEANKDYLGIGITWLMSAKDFERLCRIQSIKTLQKELKKLRGDIENEPNESWLWWKYWERNLFDDPWSWFHGKSDYAWFNEVAKKFWEFVIPTHALVVEANKKLKKR